MILQNIIFPSTETCTDEPMYFRREGKIEYAWSDDKIEIGKYALIAFDTYFNGFSLEKWQKYTCVEEIKLNITVKGHVRVTLIRKEKTIDGILTEFIEEKECFAEEPTEFTFDFNTGATMGMLCFQIIGLSKKSYFYDGNYSSDIAESKKRNVKIGLDICTYKRERYIKNNLAILNRNFLQNPNSYLFDKLEVFISDNAHTYCSK